MISKKGRVNKKISPSTQLRCALTKVGASLVAQLVKNTPEMQETAGSGRCPGKGIGYSHQYSWVALVAQMVKNLSAVQETWVQSLGLEDLLEEGIATHSSILAWRIPMDSGAWQSPVNVVTKIWT